MSAPPPVVLASTSRYRGELLRRLLPRFEQRAPGVDEAPLENEPPSERALRLAVAKAQAVARTAADALIIGSDQVAELDGQILGKPGDAETACRQLAHCSGRRVTFHTAVCVVDTRAGTPTPDTVVDVTRVQFRSLQPEEIEAYVAREQPLDCAGSFKCEGLGIALFERIDTQDPSALIGLPLIALSGLLRRHGVDVLRLPT